MKDFQKKIINKISQKSAIRGAGGGGKGDKNAGGTPKLKPPQSADLLQSHAFLGVLDLIGEGPIDGFTLKNGTRAAPHEVPSAIFYEGTPIREENNRFYQTSKIKPSDVQLIGINNKRDLVKAIDNLISNYSDFLGSERLGVAFDSKASITARVTDVEESQDALRFATRKQAEAAGAKEIIRTRVGFITLYSGYKKYYRTTIKITPISQLDSVGLGYREDFFLKFTRTIQDDQGKIISVEDISPRSGTLQGGTSNNLSTRCVVNDVGRVISIVDDSRDDPLTFKVESYTKVTLLNQKIIVNQVIQNVDNLSGPEKNIVNKVNDIITQLTIARENISDDFLDKRLGFLQYNINSIVDLSEKNYYADSITDFFAFNTIENIPYRRVIKDELTQKATFINNNYNNVVPLLDRNSSIDPKDGKIERPFRVTEFFGGGIINFYLGRDYQETVVNGVTVLDSGKYITSPTDNDFKEKIISGSSGSYDVMVFDDVARQITFGSKLDNQLSPTKGDAAGKPIDFSFISTYTDKFNYANTEVEYVLGEGNQSALGSFSYGSRDFPVNSRLLGPFKYGGDAQKGDGNNDPRKGGDMATWMQNIPAESDEFSYSHVVTTRAVEQVIPTIAIEALSDTQAEGDDIGKTLKEKITFQVEYGFEGAQDAQNFSPTDFSVNTAEFSIAGLVFEIDANRGEDGNLKIGKIFDTQGNEQPVGTTFKLLKTSAGGGLVTLQKEGTLSEADFNYFRDTDRGSLFFTITSIGIDAVGSKYSNLEDLGLFINGGDQIAEPSITKSVGNVESILKVNSADGSIMYNNSETDQFPTEKGFFGGVFSGPYFPSALSNQPVVPNFSVIVNLASFYTRSQDERRISLGISEGIDIKSLALASFTRKQDFTFNGIVASPYFVELDIGTLPYPKELRDLKYKDIGLTTQDLLSFNIDGESLVFPGETWKNVNRFIKVRKKTFETESVLIQREAVLATITEIIPTKFNYPYSALVGQNLDSRNFQRAPTRMFNMRMKKVAVPSNYNPLRDDGRDKRFVNDINSYGVRRIFNFDGETYGQANYKKNYTNVKDFEIQFKLKLDRNQTKASLIEIANTPGSFRVSSIRFEQKNNNEIRVGIDGTTLSGNPNTLKFDKALTASVSSFPGGNAVPSGNVLLINLRVVNNKATLIIKDIESNLRIGSQAISMEGVDIDFYLTNLLQNQIGPGGFFIGRSVTNNTQMADIKFYVNRELIMFFDGNVTKTFEYPYYGLNEKFGNHANFVTVSRLPGAFDNQN